MEALVPRPGSPEILCSKDYGASCLKKLSLANGRELARHAHLLQKKLERGRYLLWKRSVLMKKLQAIDDEILTMKQEDVTA
jgi:hypothetical protein